MSWDNWKTVHEGFIVDRPMYIKVGKRKIALVIPPNWKEMDTLEIKVGEDINSGDKFGG